MTAVRNGKRGGRKPKPGLCACGCGQRYRDIRNDTSRSVYVSGHNATHLGKILDALKAGDNATFAREASRYCVATKPTERAGTTDTTMEVDDLLTCMCGCGTRVGGGPYASGHHTRTNHNFVHALSGSDVLLLNGNGDVLDPWDTAPKWQFRYQLHGG